MKLFVGNLPREYTGDDLSQLLSQFGSPKNSKIIKDRETGQSRGFGFVELDTKEEANAAIAGLNGKEVGGRSLTVNEAREQEKREMRQGNRRPPRRNGGGFQR